MSFPPVGDTGEWGIRQEGEAGETMSYQKGDWLVARKGSMGTRWEVGDGSRDGTHTQERSKVVRSQLESSQGAPHLPSLRKI